MRNFEEKEEVKVVHKTSEVQTKEFEKAAKRLANANLVIFYLNRLSVFNFSLVWDPFVLIYRYWGS